MAGRSQESSAASSAGCYGRRNSSNSSENNYLYESQRSSYTDLTISSNSSIVDATQVEIVSGRVEVIEVENISRTIEFWKRSLIRGVQRWSEGLAVSGGKTPVSSYTFR